MCRGRLLMFTIFILCSFVTAPVGKSRTDGSTRSSAILAAQHNNGTGLTALVRKVIPGIAEHVAVTIVIAIILVTAGVCWRIVLWIAGRMAPVHLPNKWKTTIERGDHPEEHEKATLHQFGPWVWGKAITNTQPRRTYRLCGRIRGNYLCFRYHEDRTFDTGAALLSIQIDYKMVGIEIGVDSATNVVASFHYTWEPLES